MATGVPRVALLAVTVLLLASTLATLGAAQASSPPTYTLQGYVEGPGGSSGPAVPAGVTVVLTSSATQSTYSTQTGTGGTFSFTSTTNAPALSPGWWGLSVPPQTHVALPGIPGQWLVLPPNQTVAYAYYSSSALTTSSPVAVSGVTVAQENVTVNGTVTYQGHAIGGAQVQLLSPTLNGFVLVNNTTSTVNNKTLGLHVGYFSLQVPWGSWVLKTTIPGVLPYYQETPLTINAGNAPAPGTNLTVNPVVTSTTSYTVWGYLDLTTNRNERDPNGGNATAFEPSTGWIASQPITPGGYYYFGLPGAGTYDVFLATVGCGTYHYSITVSAGNPSASSPRNVYCAPQAAAANYTTDLTWGAGFDKLTVNTTATLSANGSVFPQLGNASVGQLWSQLALDWQHNLSFLQSNFATVANWVDSQGPFFPAGQSSTTVNSTGYGQPTNYTFASRSTCVSACGPTTNGTVGFTWNQAYNTTSKVAAGLKSYSVSFNFKHPTNSESFNYTVSLPKGYVLSAGTSVPAQSALVPAGPKGTWTAFTLVSKPSPSASGSFAFTAVKNGSVTASVNVSSSEFTWSAKNVLNQSRGNYTAIAEAGENLSFTGLNSSFPAGTNGTLYAWNFGDGNHESSANATTNHTYATHGKYAGNLTLTSSGGSQSTVPFTIYVGDAPPTAVITVNDSKVQTSSGVRYLVVNWSSALQFNASMSTANLNAGGGAPKGSISVAYWNITATSSQTWNLTSSSGANPLSNITSTFTGRGAYITQGTANGSAIPVTPFYGWQYNVTLTVWDFGGRNATTHLVVLVRDTQKPTPLITLKLKSGNTVPPSGLVESANHTAYVGLSAVNSTDPTNGSIVLYNWTVTNSGNSSVKITNLLSSAGPNYPLPGTLQLWLQPQQKAYTVNLTVTDRAGNKNYVTQSLTVAVNVSTRPILSAENLTAPTTMTDGTSYTIWANITNLGGANSTARNVSVRFFLLPPSGSGSPIAIGGSPGSVTFYQWDGKTLNASAASTGLATIAYNHTDEAKISFTPSRTGTWDVWVNATSSNEFAASYTSGENQAHVQVTLNQNPIVNEEIYAGIAVAVIAVIGVLFWFFRLRGKPKSPMAKGGSGGSSSPARLERGSKKDDDE